MKKGIKIFIIFFLLGCIVFEGWILLRKPKEDVPILQENINEEDKKYVVDSMAYYKNNDLSYTIEHDGIYYYVQIDGLKNQDIQKKVNQLIMERTKSIDKSELVRIDYSESGINEFHSIFARVRSSFSNTLSIEIGFIFRYSDDENLKYNSNVSDVIDTINIDLTTGNEIGIYDVLLSTDNFRETLVNQATEDINKGIGFLCSGGPCNNPDPHFERVEDGVISVLNQFNQNNFKYSFDQRNITLYFQNSYINAPYYLAMGVNEYDDPEMYDGCNKIISYEDEENTYYSILCNDNYTKYYQISFNFSQVLSNLIVYNKFTTEESIYKENKQKELRNFTENEFESSTIFEDGDNLYDFAVSYNEFSLGTSLFDITKKLVLQESKELKNDHMNIWRFTSGCIEKKNNYVYYIVYHYDVPKDKYEEIRKKIYDNKVNEYGYFDKEKGYSFLDEYKTKDAYYFYVIDQKGKETNVKSMLNPKYDFEAVIPKEWLSLGKYKTVKDLVNSAYIICDKKYRFDDRLVIYYLEGYEDYFYTLDVIFAYKGKEVRVNDLANLDVDIYSLFLEE